MAKKRLPRVNGTKLKPSPAPKTANIMVRLSTADRAEMVETAEQLGLTLSEYVRQLHRQAVASLKKGGK